jgi:hypothetical protein
MSAGFTCRTQSKFKSFHIPRFRKGQLFVLVLVMIILKASAHT